jgi:hypothetical protein
MDGHTVSVCFDTTLGYKKYISLWSSIKTTFSIITNFQTNIYIQVHPTGKTFLLQWRNGELKRASNLYNERVKKTT